MVTSQSHVAVGGLKEGEVLDTQAWPSRRGAYYSLSIMTVVVMFATLDRQMLSLLIDPIKKDFGVSDTQMALLLGAAFSITYGIAGIPIARIADTWNRRNLVAISVAFWGACTTAGGLAQNYTALFLSRLGLGIGESGYGPAAGR
jgi:predicted MFS family arabinose efflux permease